jgi:hypothetical protein
LKKAFFIGRLKLSKEDQETAIGFFAVLATQRSQHRLSNVECDAVSVNAIGI